MPKETKYLCPFPFTGNKVERSGTIYTLITKEDCFTFRQFIDNVDGFTLHVDKDNVLVWDKKVKGESMNLIKVFGVFECKSSELYAVLQDPLYREVWDESRVEGFKLASLDERQDVGYYAGKAPVAGVSPREFLSQRAWHDVGNGEYVIFNTAVTHSDIPDEGKGKNVRAISKVTGYFVQPWVSGKDGSEGCTLTYITQIDPSGWIPHFVMNYVTTKFASRVIDNLRKACSGYASWKSSVANHSVVTRDWNTEASAWGAPAIENKTQQFAQKQWGIAIGAVKQPVVPVSVRENDAAEEAAFAAGDLSA